MTEAVPHPPAEQAAAGGAGAAVGTGADPRHGATLAALITDAAGAPVAAVVVIGSVGGLGYLGVCMVVGKRSFEAEPRFPTPPLS